MATSESFLESHDSDEGSEWITISDLMTGPMVLFLVVALGYMIQIQLKNERMLRVAETYAELHEDLYVDLREEFKDELPRWSARLDSSSLAVTFTEPDVLFRPGSTEIRPAFAEILGDFYPRYIAILSGHKYKSEIEEIRIEGHTSSEWYGLPALDAYFMNMDLSQRRTQSVLKNAISLIHEDSLREWVRLNLTANGLSSSKLIMDGTVEDSARSRRVEFRVRTRAEDRIGKILKYGN